MMEAKPTRNGWCLRCLGMDKPAPGRCVVCDARTHEDPEVAQRMSRCVKCEKLEAK